MIRRLAAAFTAFVIAAAVWAPCLHLFFDQDVGRYYSEEEISEKAAALSAGQLATWSDPELKKKELARMRQSNAEWDFMSRTFLVLSLANMCLRDPQEKERCLDIMDSIISETILQEEENGVNYFLMDYARAGAWVASGKRSLFEDGEIALMLAARRMVEEKPEYARPLRERVDTMVRYMRESPVLCGESYPDECWMFCNVIALVAVKMSDILDGTDHTAFISSWLDSAEKNLVDKKTGLLISSFRFDGRPLDGPEGSSIWMVAHCLRVLDPELAKDQYQRARKELEGRFFGFGYAREWPDSWEGATDIDSGPVIPFFRVSAGSSGCAFIAAASFRDHGFLRRLLASLVYAGFPEEKNGRLRFLAGNQVGDSVMLYSTTLGPLWEKIMEGTKQ